MSNFKQIAFEESVINENILEIRYKPKSLVLDHRGEWAEALSRKLNLPHWKITENRIDVHDNTKGNPDDAFERGFISYKNFGYVLRNAASGSQFNERFNNLIDFIFDQSIVFEKTIEINRIGVFTRIGNKFEGDFIELLSLYIKNYMVPTQKTISIFNSEIIDFGGYLHFRSSEGFEMNTMTGPMDEKQSKGFFPFDDNPPSPILYFEIDSFFQQNQEYQKINLKKNIELLTRNNWLLNKRVINVLLGN